MGPIFCNMLDVVRIVTFQPTAASSAAERIRLEREFRAAEAAIAAEQGSATVRAAKHEPKRLRGWLSFSFMPR